MIGRIHCENPFPLNDAPIAKQLAELIKNKIDNLEVLPAKYHDFTPSSETKLKHSMNIRPEGGALYQVLRKEEDGREVLRDGTVVLFPDEARIRIPEDQEIVFIGVQIDELQVGVQDLFIYFPGEIPREEVLFIAPEKTDKPVVH